MKYLIRDLARMSHLSPARIRKWQERFEFLQPTRADNGYYYYSNDDLFILKEVSSQLAQGRRISDILSAGRESLLSGRKEKVAAISQVARWAADGQYALITDHFNRVLAEKGARGWLRALNRECIEIGHAWSLQQLSVSDEHAFSRWCYGYLHYHAFQPQADHNGASWLISSYHDDVHELGALMLFAHLRLRNRSVRFVGNLPREELLSEISRGGYKNVCISFVMPVKKKVFDHYRAALKERFPAVRFWWGGYGLRNHDDETDS